MAQVFDKDIVGSDDFMGEAGMELTELTITKCARVFYNFILQLKEVCRTS
jgi:hypothetical protein